MISIIVPIYNKEKTLKKCVESLIRQSYQDIEVLCVDDSSVDNSILMITELLSCDKRVKLLSLDHKGVGFARNTGIKKAIGDYICFCDADDYFEENGLERLLSNVLLNGSDIVCCDFVEEYEEREVIHSLEHYSLFDMFFEETAIWNKLYKKDFLIKNDIMFPESNRGEDRVFLAKCFSWSPQVTYEKGCYYHWVRSCFAEGSLNSIINLSDLQERLDNWLLFLDILREKYYEKACDNVQCGKKYLMELCEQLSTEKEKEKAKEMVEMYYTSYFNL